MALLRLSHLDLVKGSPFLSKDIVEVTSAAGQSQSPVPSCHGLVKLLQPGLCVGLAGGCTVWQERSKTGPSASIHTGGPTAGCMENMGVAKRALFWWPILANRFSPMVVCGESRCPMAALSSSCQSRTSLPSAITSVIDFHHIFFAPRNEIEILTLKIFCAKKKKKKTKKKREKLKHPK